MSKIARNEQRKELIKEKIINSAENVFRKKGIRETTMEDIAEEALYSKAAIYQYFSSKEEFIVVISIKALHILNEMFTTGTAKYSNSLDKIGELGNQHFKFMTELAFYQEVLDHLASVNFTDEKLQVKLLDLKEIDEKIENIMIEIIAQGQNEGEITTTTDARTMAMLLKGMSSGINNMIKQVCGRDPILFESEGKRFYEEFQIFIEKSIKVN